MSKRHDRLILLVFYQNTLIERTAENYILPRVQLLILPILAIATYIATNLLVMS